MELPDFHQNFKILEQYWLMWDRTHFWELFKHKITLIKIHVLLKRFKTLIRLELSKLCPKLFQLWVVLGTAGFVIAFFEVVAGTPRVLTKVLRKTFQVTTGVFKSSTGENIILCDRKIFDLSFTFVVLTWVWHLSKILKFWSKLPKYRPEFPEFFPRLPEF